MATNICETAFKREAAELATRLERGKGYLLPSGRAGEWNLWSCKNNFARPVGKSVGELVSEMQARGMFKERPGGGLMLARKGDGRGTPAKIVAPDGSNVVVTVNETECALGWLKGRKDQSGGPVLSEEQFAAAERLRNDYTLAQMEQRMTANWDAPIVSGLRGSRPKSEASMGDVALAAKQRLFAALADAGPELSGVLLEVCCMASGLENAERALGLPRRSGKAVLQIALTRLARHYGLLPEQSPVPSDRRLRHWSVPDSRPRIV